MKNLYKDERVRALYLTTIKKFEKGVKTTPLLYLPRKLPRVATNHCTLYNTLNRCVRFPVPVGVGRLRRDGGRQRNYSSSAGC